MDGKGGMTLPGGSSSYYIHRGISGSGSGSQAGALHLSPGLGSFSNPNFPSQLNAQPSTAPATAFSIEQSSHANFGHNTGLPQAAPPVKKKKGRPRKYAPDGQVSLGLSPLPVRPKPSSASDPMTPKRARGRPPGSGRKQQLSLHGEWMNSSAGQAFATHVITIAVGEDIVTKILSFSQRRPRAVCILSGTGMVSSVTLHQPASSGPSLTYEGRFQILCLSGSFLVTEDGGPRSRTGGMSVSLSSPDGHVIGGAVAMLIAASPVQVVLCSFAYGGYKVEDSLVAAPKDEGRSAHQSGDNSITPKSAVPTSMPSQNYRPPPVNMWPNLRPVDQRNPHADIDMTHG